MSIETLPTHDKSIEFGTIQGKLYQYLEGNPDSLLTYDVLNENVWQEIPVPGTTGDIARIKAQLSNLRKIFPNLNILNVQGRGYVLSAQEVQAEDWLQVARPDLSHSGNQDAGRQDIYQALCWGQVCKNQKSLRLLPEWWERVLLSPAVGQTITLAEISKAYGKEVKRIVPNPLVRGINQRLEISGSSLRLTNCFAEGYLLENIKTKQGG